MKTLKILTLVAIVGLIVVIISIVFTGTDNEFNYNDEKTEFASSDVNNKESVSGLGYDIGDSATDFSLKNIDDTMVSLSDYNDAKGFIIIFTCNHCPYSVAYEDRIIDIDKEFKKKGYPVIAINPNDTPSYPNDSFENMKKRANEKSFTFPYLFDKGQRIYPQYGATKTPHVFLLKKESTKYVVKYIGAIDDNYKNANAVKNEYLRDALNALLTDRPIKQTKTVAIGCSIKS